MTMLALTSLLATVPAAQPADVFEPKAVRTWTIELPADPFQTISGMIPIPHDAGEGFRVTAAGEGLGIDTDGDGEVDRTVEGREHPDTKVRHARVVLSGERDGQAFRYPVRLEVQDGSWAWASSSVMRGTLGGTEVQLIDLNGNGSFSDVGKDAMTVGGSDVAQFIGETLSIGGELHSVSFAKDGTSAELSAYDGDTGLLDVRSAFGGKGVLLGAVVQSVNGKHSFEVGAAEDSVDVPTGRYRLVSASLGLGDARAHADTRSMRSIRVKKNETAQLKWGAPIKASFTYDASGSEVVLDPAKLRYIGAAGERWVGWNPIGKSPTFLIKDAETGKVLVDAVFPGSC